MSQLPWQQCDNLADSQPDGLVADFNQETKWTKVVQIVQNVLEQMIKYAESFFF